MVQVLDWLSFAFGGLQLCLKASVVFFLLMRRVGSVLVKKKGETGSFLFFLYSCFPLYNIGFLKAIVLKLVLFGFYRQYNRR